MYKLDYVWLDGYETKNMRMKTRYFNGYELDIKDVPVWGFDGSSTEQADGNNSDCILEPVKLYRNTIDPMGMSHIVLCEVMNPDGTPHATNTRAKMRKVIEQCGGLEKVSKDMMFGIEQEYVIFDKKILVNLIKSKQDIVLAIDKKSRLKNTMRVKIKNSCITDIGNHVKTQDCDGNFTGLAKFSSKGSKIINKELEKYKNSNFNEYYTFIFNDLAKKKMYQICRCQPITLERNRYKKRLFKSKKNL